LLVNLQSGTTAREFVSLIAIIWMAIFFAGARIGNLG